MKSIITIITFSITLFSLFVVNSSANPPILDGLKEEQQNTINRLFSQNVCSEYVSSEHTRVNSVSFIIDGRVTVDGSNVLEFDVPYSETNSVIPVESVYAGIGKHNDIIILRKLDNGSIIVTLSFCTFEYWISKDTVVNSFLSQGLTLGPSVQSIGKLQALNTFTLMTTSSEQETIPSNFYPFK